MDRALYCFGFTLVIIYLLTGADDFAWDIIALARGFFTAEKRLDTRQLDSVPPKLLAVLVAAWHEENVLGDVIDNVIASAQYPQSMYHIFLGVYPNDEATIKVAESLEKKHFNVHVIVNRLPGPTSKAQNINNIIRELKVVEKLMNWRFASITIHDSEDVVHPYEFKVTNYLLDTRELIQFPVFPLIKKPTFRNFFDNITTATYADEFAENHYSTMRNRRDMGVFVPSAGTGYVISRKLLDLFGDGDVLPNDSLTEDYRLALTFFEKGLRTYYVLERVPRITENYKIAWDYIATRSIFPNTFKTAVKQKCRWVLGITMQSTSFKAIMKNKQISFAGRYSLYKDHKSKICNLLSFIGYPVLIYYMVSLFAPTLTPIYPKYSMSWYLSAGVMVMMLERQIFRGFAIYNVYGARSLFFACFFPPIVSVRVVWGNMINLVATIRAYKQSAFGIQKTKVRKEKAKVKYAPAHLIAKPKKLAWAKTDHSFLEESVLRRYRRRLGDVLVEKGYLTLPQLKRALRDLAYKDRRMGRYLIEKNLINEEQLLFALSQVKAMAYVNPASLECYDLPQFAGLFDEKLLKELLVVPILKASRGFVVAFCENSSPDAGRILRKRYHIKLAKVLMSEKGVEKAIDMMFYPGERGSTKSLINILYERRNINHEQVIIANNYKTTLKKKDAYVLAVMGLIGEE